jgi:peroxiredoxin (alkyl hydroperoxide reductase subunit C)
MAVEVGSEAPDFTLRDENGEEVALSSLRGRNVVLMFFPAAFSGICTKELHRSTDLADRYDAAGAEVFGISVDSPYALRAWKRDESLSAHFLSDFHPKGAVAQAYEAYIPEAGVATRVTYVIDKEGKIAHKMVNHPGEMRDQDEILDALAACPV